MKLVVKITNSIVALTCCRTSAAIVLILICAILIIFCAKNLICHNHDQMISTFTFHHNPIPSNKDSVLYCVVCLNEVMDGERFRELPKCNHCFHVNCIDVWFQYHSTCPLCRNQVCSANPDHQQKHRLLHQFLSILQFFSWQNM